MSILSHVNTPDTCTAAEIEDPWRPIAHQGTRVKTIHRSSSSWIGIIVFTGNGEKFVLYILSILLILETVSLQMRLGRIGRKTTHIVAW